MNSTWLSVQGLIERGHRVASGEGDDPRYPDGTLHLQIPIFKQQGLDLSTYHRATLNISIRPRTWTMLKPLYTFRQVEWTSHHPPEDFSFARGAVVFGGVRYDGWVYQPHPETKRDHFQDASIVEFIAPFIPGISHGSSVTVMLDPEEVTVMLEAG
jgi:hypothetical protein